MKLSLNWIRSLNDAYTCAADPAPDGIEALVERIGAQLGAVEEVVNLGERYKGIVVVKVVSAEKHPNADKLKVCLIDDSGVVKDVERDNRGYVQVVCGAPNVAAGQLVAWLPPGSIVPATFGKDPFRLEAREIRGQKSNGMIASAKELAIGDDHEGILVIDPQVEVVKSQDEEINHKDAMAAYQQSPKVKPGADFAELYGLNDYIIDIENKMFTHRPDLFGQLGLAREVAGIQGHKFVSPPVYKAPKTTGKFAMQRLPIEIQNDIPQQVPRFVAQVFRNIKVGPSAVWMQTYLARVGIRPINNIVDITNYFMMLTGQPLHAYDYDKIKTGKMGVRLSLKGEKLKLIGGKEITLGDGAVVITDGQKPIGLGGVMGGADTEVDQNTKNIILEVANFDMNLTRKTAMAYGLFTDAATRFTKNLSPWQCDRVLAWANGEIIHQAGGTDDGMIYDLKSDLSANSPVKLTTQFANDRLGSDLSADEIKKLLENVEFAVEQDGNNLMVTAPFWRTDIEIPEDVVEEIGRLYGYDKLPVSLPKRDLAPAPLNYDLHFKDFLRSLLKQAGANETLTYSFVHESLLEKAGQITDQAFHIRNAISPDLQYYRLSLTPSLLSKVHANIRAGFDKFAIYELGKVHSKTEAGDDGLPAEFDRLSLVIAGSQKTAGAPYFWAKKYMDYLCEKTGLQVDYEELANVDLADHQLTIQMIAPFEPRLSAAVKVDGQVVGVIGEFKSSLKKSMKLPPACAGLEIFISALQKGDQQQYEPLNKFPELEQDFCLRSSAEISYGRLAEFMRQGLAELSANRGYRFKLSPLDIFQKQGDKEHKQTTWRIVMWHPERTLTTEETNRLLDELASRAKDKLNAERI